MHPCKTLQEAQTLFVPLPLFGYRYQFLPFHYQCYLSAETKLTLTSAVFIQLRNMMAGISSLQR